MTVWLSDATPRCVAHRTENRHSCKHLPTSVHSSTIHTRRWHLLGVKDCLQCMMSGIPGSHSLDVSGPSQSFQNPISKSKSKSKTYINFPESPGFSHCQWELLIGSLQAERRRPREGCWRRESAGAGMTTCVSPTHADILSMLSFRPPHKTLKHGHGFLPTTWFPPPTGKIDTPSLDCLRRTWSPIVYKAHEDRSLKPQE